MANTARTNAVAGREDISQFIIHLTRDDRDTFGDTGSPARENFLSILKSRKIRAIQPHCLFNERLKKLSAVQRDKLKVACFTEVPLNQLHLLVSKIPGRRIKLESYGFVFTKEFITESVGQPAIYVNSYNGNLWLREAVDELFEVSYENNKFVGKTWRLLPFINAMHEKYDFSWEREWRVVGDLKFRLNDLVCVVLPNEDDEDLKEKLARSGIAVISPGWTYEQIVTQLARQQRSTKQLVIDQIEKVPKEKSEQ